MADINKDCKLYNNSDNAIVVLDTYNSAANDTDILYECVPKVLTTVSGQAIINKNTSDSVILDDEIPDKSERTVHYDSDKENDTSYSTYYELILAQPNNLFPVKYVGEMLKFSTKTYPDITLVQADTKKISLAYQFYQMLLAYPTSNLARDFFLALTQAWNKGESVQEIESIIANFLSSTPPYQSVDSATYAAVVSYMQSYPNSFAAAATTYYLYSAPNTTKQKAAPVYEGMLVFAQKTPVPDVADPRDPNGGYQLHFYYPNGKIQDLDYDQGQCVSDTHQDHPAICLQGSFMNKRHLTYLEEDNEIIPVWIGVINGVQVLGTSVKQETDSGEETEGSFYAFWHPTTLVGWLTLFSSLLILACAVHVIVKVINLLIKSMQSETARLRETTGDDTSELSSDQVNNIKNESKYEIPRMVTWGGDLVNRIYPRGEAIIPTDEPVYDSVAEETNTLLTATDYNGALNAFVEALNLDAKSLQTLTDYGVTPEMQKMINNIRVAFSDFDALTDEIESAIQNHDYDKLEKLFPEIQKTFDSHSGLINESVELIKDRLKIIWDVVLDEVKEEIQVAIEKAQECNCMSEASKKTGDDTNEGEIDDDTKPIPPPLPDDLITL